MAPDITINIPPGAVTEPFVDKLVLVVAVPSPKAIIELAVTAVACPDCPNVIVAFGAPFVPAVRTRLAPVALTVSVAMLRPAVSAIVAPEGMFTFPVWMSPVFRAALPP